MAKRGSAPQLTRKHLARAQRERMLRTRVLLGLLVLAATVAGVLAFGWYDVNVRQPRQPVANVDGEEITTRQFRARVRILQEDLRSQLESDQQLLTIFADNPQIQSSLQQRIGQVSVGQAAIDQLVEEALIRQEAGRRGITIAESEIDRAIGESIFNYFPLGTPTSLPTLTSEPTATTDASEQGATPEATEGPSPTPSPPLTPTLAPTPYTEEAFRADYQTYLANLAMLGILESDIKARFEAYLDQEQAHVRHILVDDEEQAVEVLTKLNEAAAWEDLVAEYSTDPGTVDRGGDLGWFARGRMVQELEQVSFEAEIGQISGPIQSRFGWHIIEVLGREVRPLDEQGLERALQLSLSDLLSSLRSEGDIQIQGFWIDRVPSIPRLDTLQVQ